jgi:phospholipid/cholesterol/gamma-HCH transport system permease protein
MAGRGELALERTPDAGLRIRLGGEWRLAAARPGVGEVERALASPPLPRRVEFDARELAGWDSGILTFLSRVLDLCRARGIPEDRSGLPPGVRKLLALAEAVPEREGARGPAPREGLLGRVGSAGIRSGRALFDMVGFVGEIAVATLSVVRLRARIRAVDVLEQVEICGARALPIVTLISFLVGLILAFVGAVQLRQFGAAIYVADLVAIAMVREMGAMMTAIIMAGRTGAAFAAQLGTMKVTEETDALVTMGFPPVEFLVMPRVLALALMMPLLTLYSDFVGILGGAVIGVTMLDLPAAPYFNQTVESITLVSFSTGLVKSAVFGCLIAYSGCLRGIQCGDSASAVGEAATSAVVTSIVLIVVTDGIFAVIFEVLGI